jgi:hypothetical protein
MIRRISVKSCLLAAMHVTTALWTADAMTEWRYFDLEALIHGGAISPRHVRLPSSIHSPGAM